MTSVRAYARNGLIGRRGRRRGSLAADQFLLDPTSDPAESELRDVTGRSMRRNGLVVVIGLVVGIVGEVVVSAFTDASVVLSLCAFSLLGAAAVWTLARTVLSVETARSIALLTAVVLAIGLWVAPLIFVVWYLAPMSD